MFHPFPLPLISLRLSLPPFDSRSPVPSASCDPPSLIHFPRSIFLFDHRSRNLKEGRESSLRRRRIIFPRLGSVKYLSNRAFHSGEYETVAGREERQRRRFGLSRHPLSFIFRQIFRRRGNGEEEGRESDRGFIASPRNWLKYVSVSRGNSAEQGNAFRKFQPPLHPLLLALPLFARDEARRNLLLPFFRKFRIEKCIG